MVDKEDLIRKIRSLFALASSSNENEAKSALAMAHRLMNKYAIEEFEIKKNDDIKYGALLFFSTNYWKYHNKLICAILQRYFHVKVLVKKTPLLRKSNIYLYGTESNCMFAQYVYNFLLAKFEELWTKEKDKWGKLSRKNQKDFYAGLTSGFMLKLEENLRTNRSDSRALIIIDSHLEKKFNEQIASKTRLGNTEANIEVSSSYFYRNGVNQGRKIEISKQLE